MSALVERDIPRWHSPARWEVGDLVQWRGVQLVCTRAHASMQRDAHPWAAAKDLRTSLASELWTPNGRQECAKLLALTGDRRMKGSSQRLITILALASGQYC